MNDVLRVSEVYTSVQGEGNGTGELTQFVRFGGCNLKCPGWPCDTQHAIDPKYRNEWTSLSVDELLAQVDDFPHTVTLTGGEPFLQPKTSLFGFVEALWERNFLVDIFTNGTLPIPSAMFGMCHFILDWKLTGSGEKYEVSTKYYQQRLQNVGQLGAQDLVKFTCKTWQDVLDAERAYRQINELQLDVGYTIGRTWDSDVSDHEIVEFLKENKLDWKLNVQMHKHIWPADKRGV